MSCKDMGSRAIIDLLTKKLKNKSSEDLAELADYILNVDVEYLGDDIYRVSDSRLCF